MRKPNVMADPMEVISSQILLPGGIMSLVFIGIDPESYDTNCPAVFADEETGDLVFQGWTVTDPQILEDVGRHSPIADHESVVRLPARMRPIILEALNGQGATIQRADRDDSD